ncbi:MAG: IS630 family transposase [Anaerolineae bacterium]|nr:IS630 family transposase [Anaerolineae bacterium]
MSERIHMVLLSSRGYTVPRIAEIFDCDEATVRYWIARFEAEGVPGLRDRPRPGRPRKADAVAQSLIRQHIETPPSAFGYLFTFWTVVTLCAHVETTFGVQLSHATIRRALLTLKYRRHRPRHELRRRGCQPSDPGAAAAARSEKCGHLVRRRVQCAPAAGAAGHVDALRTASACAHGRHEPQASRVCCPATAHRAPVLPHL